VIGRLNVSTFGGDFGGEEHSLVVPEMAARYSPPSGLEIGEW
jgi:hypothetical protein